MRRYFETRTVAAVGTLLMVVGCSGTRLTPAQARGKQIYESLCDKCHRLIAPKSLSDEQWNAASEKYGGPLKLTADDIAQLKAYLTRANDQDF